MEKKTKTVTKKTGAKAAAAEPKAAQLIVPSHTFTLTIPTADTAAARARALARAQQSVKIDGFRQGKVPLKLVEERIGVQGLLELMVDDLLPKAYRQYLEENKLQPLTDPEVTPKSLEEGKDWEFEVAIAVAPEVELGDYAALVKAAPAPEHGEHDGHEYSAEDLKQIKLQAILGELLKKIPVKVPELLLRKETEHRLRQVSRQLEKLNLTLEDYLKNIKKTQEELQQEYAVSTLASLQVELLLAAIIKAAGLKVETAELEDLVKARLANRKPEEKISREELNYLHSALLKQKAIDHILGL
jgi:FKBP-type peptidyl-prolyl cis-trans isomerase (trigger factor)